MESGFRHMILSHNPTKVLPINFQPNWFNNCLVWLRADKVVLNGSTVSQWTDLSGNAAHMTQPTAGVQPTFTFSESTLNGQPAVRFTSASSTTMFHNPVVSAQPYEVIFATTFIGPAGLSGVQLNIYASANGPEAGAFAGPGLYLNAGSTISGPASLPLSTGVVCSYVFNNTTSKIYMNNSQTAIGSGNGGAGTLASTFNLGSAGANFMNGNIGEMIVYSTSLSNAARLELFAYLGARYKITVS